MVGGRLHDRQEVALGRGIERLPAVHAREFRGDRADLPADQLAEIEVDAPVGREVRMKGHPEETRFAIHVHARAQVREIHGRRRRGVVLERADPAALLDHEPARAVIRRLLHRDRRCERQARECARCCNAVGSAGGYRRRHAAAAASTTGEERDRTTGRPENASLHGNSLACSVPQKTAQTARSFAAAASRVASCLAKQKRTSRAAERFVAEWRQRNRCDAVLGVSSLQKADVGQIRDRRSSRRAGNRCRAGQQPEARACQEGREAVAARLVERGPARPRNSGSSRMKSAIAYWSRRRDREGQELVHLAEFDSQRRRGDAIADLPAGRVVGLAEREDRERAVAQARIRRARLRGGVRRRRALRTPRRTVQQRIRRRREDPRSGPSLRHQHCARRVVRRVDDQQPRARIDGGREALVVDAEIGSRSGTCTTRAPASSAAGP